MIAWPKLARLARPFDTVMFPRTLFGKLPTRHQQGDLCPVWSARAATKKWDWKAVQITALQWTCQYEDHLKESIHINSFSNCDFFYMHQHIKTICLYLFHVLSELKELLPASPGQGGWAFGRCPSCHVEDWLPHGCEAQRGWPQRANMNFMKRFWYDWRHIMSRINIIES